MYTLYKFHFLYGITEINQLFDDILIIWPAPVYIYIYIYTHTHTAWPKKSHHFDLNQQIVVVAKV